MNQYAKETNNIHEGDLDMENSELPPGEGGSPHQ